MYLNITFYVLFLDVGGSLYHGEVGSQERLATFFRCDLVMKIFLQPFALLLIQAVHLLVVCKKWAHSTGKLPRGACPGNMWQG